MKETHSQARIRSNTHTHMRNPQWTGFQFPVSAEQLLMFSLINLKDWFVYLFAKLALRLCTLETSLCTSKCTFSFDFPTMPRKVLLFAAISHSKSMFFFWLFHAFIFDKVKQKKCIPLVDLTSPSSSCSIRESAGAEQFWLIDLYLTINRPFFSKSRLLSVLSLIYNSL